MSKNCAICQTPLVSRPGVVRDLRGAIVPLESLPLEAQEQSLVWECLACRGRPRGLSGEHTFSIPLGATCQQILEDLVYWVSHQTTDWGFEVDGETAIDLEGNTYRLKVQEDALGRMGFLAQLTALFTMVGYTNYVGTANEVECLSFHPMDFDKEPATKLCLVQEH